MGKALYIAEKPSVAQEFARALKMSARRNNGYIEDEKAIVTWCVGHLVTMSYPEVYDEKMKRWQMETLPFLPEHFLYEVIPAAAKQFQIVSGLLNREDVDLIYVCTDSGREGEYIYRLVEQQAGVEGKTRKRVWIDSQTEEEILRGIREAKDLSAYDNLSASAYLRAKEDYLMGINFSRLLTLKYGATLSGLLHTKYSVISVGRVMTCVLGMVVRREREIRDFVETPFYRILAVFKKGEAHLEAYWKVTEDSACFGSPKLYRDNGFLSEEEALAFVGKIRQTKPLKGIVSKVEKKQEKKNPPLLFNLAELQNTAAKRFKISPDETLKIVQELYERKMVTYPRTDARVLSTAAAKEIHKNLRGLTQYPLAAPFAEEILAFRGNEKILKSRYVNDGQITDHYAIIPTGQATGQLEKLGGLHRGIYQLIVKRFLSIFFPPAVYEKLGIVITIGRESFFSGFKALKSKGFLKLDEVFEAKPGDPSPEDEDRGEEGLGLKADMDAILPLKRGEALEVGDVEVKEGKTSPPKRYNSGSLILAMENAGQLIEDEELREHIRGSGIGTSATRGEILKKLMTIRYLKLNKKTQVVTPALFGELVYDAVRGSIQSLLNPALTASWEKGLSYVANGDITSDEYTEKLNQFIEDRTNRVKSLYNQNDLRMCYQKISRYYKGKE